MNRAALARTPLGAIVRAGRKTIHIGRYRITRSGPPPAAWKRRYLARTLRAHSLDYFVETGTHLGDTVAHLRHNYLAAWTIEIDAELHTRAVERFAFDDHVHVLHGDSGALLPGVIRDLPGPTLFWLDGHWSGAGTGCGDVDTPISAELDAILSDSRKHVIVIDDAREFGQGDYPPIRDIIQAVADKRAGYTVNVADDMVTIAPGDTGRRQHENTVREDSRQGGVGRR
jgi:hypothetical protein